MSHLFDKSVVGTIQVDFSQVVPVGKDQVGLLLCADTKKTSASGWSWLQASTKIQDAHKRSHLMWTCRWWGHWV